MGLDSLFERLVTATERIANAMEGASVKLKVELPETPTTIAESEKPTRRKKSGGDKVEAMTPAETAAITAAAPAPEPPKAKSFLDDEDEAPTVQAAPVKTEKERRDDIRSGLQKVQAVTTPDNAFAILKNQGKVEVLRDLKPEQFDAVDKAIAEALAKEAARKAA